MRHNTKEKSSEEITGKWRVMTGQWLQCRTLAIGVWDRLWAGRLGLESEFWRPSNEDKGVFVWVDFKYQQCPTAF